MMQLDKTPSVLVETAIENGKKHGTNLVAGKMNKADGNCAFNTVIHNINYRPCFGENLNLSSLDYRQICMTDLQTVSVDYPIVILGGYTEEEKSEK